MSQGRMMFSIWRVVYRSMSSPTENKTMEIDADVNKTPEEALQVARGNLDTAGGGPFLYQSDYRIVSVTLGCEFRRPRKH